MSYTEDVLLFKQVLEEMGIPLQEGQGGITINGIPATQYLDEHDIFAVPELENIWLIFKGDIYELYRKVFTRTKYKT